MPCLIALMKFFFTEIGLSECRYYFAECTGYLQHLLFSLETFLRETLAREACKA